VSKISELSDGGSLVSSDYLIAVRSGGNVKVRMDQINVDQVDLGDNEFIRLGNSQDLTMVHTSTQSIINQAGIGDLLLQKAGTTKASITANGLEFPDNSKAIFGAGSDLQIYHDGDNSYINDSGVGDLKLGGNQLQLNNAAQTKNYIYAVDGAQVELKYNNALKLATTATGIDVTGLVTASNSLVITGGITGHGANRATFSQEGAGGAYIQSYGANTSTMGAFVFRQASSDFSLNATPLTISATGVTTFGGSVVIDAAVPSSQYKQSGTGKYLTGISAVPNGGVTGSVSGDWFGRTAGGKMFWSTDDGVTANMTLDASGNVGIGVSPSQKLHVYQSATDSQSYVAVQNNRSRNAAVLTQTTNGGFYTGTSVGTDTFCWQVYDASQGERLRIDSNGHLILKKNLVLESTSEGIDFSGVGAAAQTLDSYEEGTWTPTVNFNGISIGTTYTKQLGRYTKIGRMVYASFDIVLLNKGSSVGGVTIDGLPIANYGSHQNNAGTVICESGGVDWPQSGVYGMVWVDGNIYLRQQGTTAYAAVDNTNFSNTTKIFGMMVYEAT
jgi:hypothetical protein